MRYPVVHAVALTLAVETKDDWYGLTSRCFGRCCWAPRRNDTSKTPCCCWRWRWWGCWCCAGIVVGVSWMLMMLLSLLLMLALFLFTTNRHCCAGRLRRGQLGVVQNRSMLGLGFASCVVRIIRRSVAGVARFLCRSCVTTLYL